MRAVPIIDTPAGRFETMNVQTPHFILESCYAIQLYIIALYNTIWFLRGFPSNGHKTETAYIVITTNNDEILWRTGH